MPKAILCAKERILLHLLKNPVSREALEVPKLVTQDGLAEGVGITRNNITREVNLLEGEGLIVSDRRYVPPYGIKHSAYFLTESGCMEAKRVAEVASHLVVADPRTREKYDIARLAQKYSKVPVPAILRFVRDDRVLDCEAIDRYVAEHTRKAVGDPPRRATLFIGREGEKRTMLEWLLSSDARIFCLYGMAGMGKTALVVEFIQSYAPDWNLAWVRVTRTTTGETVLRLIDELLSSAGDWTLRRAREEGRWDSPAIWTLLVERMRGRDAIVVLDDFQNASPELSDAMGQLTAALRGGSLRLFVVSRHAPSFFDRRLVTDDGLVCEHNLRGLEDGPAMEILRGRRYGGHILEAVRLAGGHPLFLRLIDPTQAGLGYNLERFIDDTLLKGFEDDEVRLLQRIAVHRIPPHHQWVMSSYHDARALRRLAESGVVSRDGHTLSVHDIIKTHIIDALPRTEMLRMHSETADALAPLDVAALKIEALYHLVQSGRKGDAASLAYSSLGMISDAGLARELEKILSLVRPDDIEGEPRKRLMLSLGRVGTLFSKWDSAVAAYWTVVKEYPRDGEACAEAWKGMAILELRRGRLEVAAGHLERAMSSVRCEEGSDLELRYLKATIEERRGMMAEAERTLQALARDAGERRDVLCQGKALYGLGRLHIKTGDKARGLADMEAAKDIFRSCGSVSEEMRILLGMGAAYFSVGRSEEALATLHQCHDIAERVGDQYIRGYALGNMADILIDAGRLDEAIELAGMSRAISRTLGDDSMTLSACARECRGLMARGDMTAVARALSDTRSVFERSPPSQAKCMFLVYSSNLSSVEGDDTRALAELKSALAMAVETGLRTTVDFITKQISDMPSDATLFGPEAPEGQRAGTHDSARTGRKGKGKARRSRRR